MPIIHIVISNNNNMIDKYGENIEKFTLFKKENARL